VHIWTFGPQDRVQADDHLLFRLLNEKFSEDSKNVLKTVIVLLQVDFTGDFVTDCPLNRVQIQFQLILVCITPLFPK